MPAQVAAAAAPVITPAIATLISAGIGLFSSSRSRRDARRRSAEALKRQQEQQARLDEEIEKYRAIKFENPYQNIENPFEDLTVNQQAAQFQAQQTSQQMADVMANLRSAAGSSGISGLAQTLANQGALSTQRISAGIGQQEAANQRLAAQGAAQAQRLELTGESNIEQAKRDRQATLLGMQMGEATGANAAFSQAQANQMNAQIAQQQALISGIQGTVSTGFQAQEAGMFDYSEGTPGYKIGQSVKQGSTYLADLIKEMLKRGQTPGQ